jgi:hypothetical protein
MRLHEILIPVKSNSGKTFSRKDNRQFADYVVSLAGDYRRARHCLDNGGTMARYTVNQCAPSE